jgi:hypothetical protein
MQRARLVQNPSQHHDSSGSVFIETQGCRNKEKTTLHRESGKDERRRIDV